MRKSPVWSLDRLSLIFLGFFTEASINHLYSLPGTFFQPYRQQEPVYTTFDFSPEETKPKKKPIKGESKFDLLVERYQSTNGCILYGWNSSSFFLQGTICRDLPDLEIVLTTSLFAMILSVSRTCSEIAQLIKE